MRVAFDCQIIRKVIFDWVPAPRLREDRLRRDDETRDGFRLKGGMTWVWGALDCKSIRLLSGFFGEFGWGIGFVIRLF